MAVFCQERRKVDIAASSSEFVWQIDGRQVFLGESPLPETGDPLTACSRRRILPCPGITTDWFWTLSTTASALAEGNLSLWPVAEVTLHPPSYLACSGNAMEMRDNTSMRSVP